MDWKRFGKKLLFLPVWLMALLTIASAVLLTTVFIKGWEQQVIAYFVYVLSFYTLSVVTLFCVMVLPKQYSKIKQKVYDNPFGNRYMTDRAFRTKISLYVSLSISLLYVGINIWSWHFSRSWWFVVLAVYYSILSLMRFLLVRYVQRNAIGSSPLAEWKRSRTCACILLLVNLSLSGAVLMILYQDRGFSYDGILIYAIALYTFYSLIHTAVDLVRYRRLGSPVMSTARIVSLSSALVSLLNLETAMFDQFGVGMAPEHQRIFIILTGAGISVIVVTMSVMLILRANKEIRSVPNGTN